MTVTIILAEENNPYRIWLSNFGYWANARSASLEAAKDRARRLCFESLICRHNSDGSDTPLVSFSPIGGFRPVQ